jgi:hypothetical protein
MEKGRLNEVISNARLEDLYLEAIDITQQPYTEKKAN